MDADKLRRHVRETVALVSTWPAWKQLILQQSMSPVSIELNPVIRHKKSVSTAEQTQEILAQDSRAE